MGHEPTELAAGDDRELRPPDRQRPLGRDDGVVVDVLTRLGDVGVVVGRAEWGNFRWAACRERRGEGEHGQHDEPHGAELRSHFSAVSVRQPINEVNA